MAAEATPGVAGVVRGQSVPRRSVGGLIAISIFWFALNFHWQALNGIIVTSQVIGLLFRAAPAGVSTYDWVKQYAPLIVPVVGIPGLAVALMANPLFGQLSDRTPGRLGRRRPYILAGTALNVVGLAVMAMAPGYFVIDHSGNPLGASIVVLLVGLMITQLANNAAAAPFHALLPDMVPQQQRGVASGVMGMAQMLGTIGGAIAPVLLGFNSESLLKGKQSITVYSTGVFRAYVIVAVVIVLMAGVTGFVVREQPWKASDSPASYANVNHIWRDMLVTVLAVVVVTGATWAIVQLFGGIGRDPTSDLIKVNLVQLSAVAVAGIGVVRAFDYRPRRYPDFSWVLATRLLMMMGIYIVYDFLQLYMQFVAHASDPQAANATFIVILILSATVSTAFAGLASDRLGRKTMVYISGAFMAMVGAAFIVAPYLVPTSILTVAYAAAAVFGLGYGAYVSVDWALVADVLPSQETYARDMGVWNIVYVIPQALAFVFGAWMIALGTAVRSTLLGYTFLFIGFVVFAVAGTVTVRYIRGVR